ncbi:unnamed protein product [Caenorhabditis auriculariae]|uniref:Uncharacterized protein n=1 Tax=Caenorhabditis auriculariae TaxID=2777116 RepID=A0A8S1H551_9PELO|nr:unnamed protein product [Caenorhabditis auriculariae]
MFHNVWTEFRHKEIFKNSFQKTISKPFCSKKKLGGLDKGVGSSRPDTVEWILGTEVQVGRTYSNAVRVRQKADSAWLVQIFFKTKNRSATRDGSTSSLHGGLK